MVMYNVGVKLFTLLIFGQLHAFGHTDAQHREDAVGVV